MDTSTLAQKMVAAVRGAIAAAVAKSDAATGVRLAEFETRLQAIPAGAKGEPGASVKGEQGDKGDKGDKGDAAEPIHPDTVALMVREAVERAVAALPVAKDGEPGRDAAQLEPLPSIDEAKSYPRGTWASHAGGLLRAARATDPVTDGLAKAGWVVMVEGVAAVVVSQGDDPRELSVAAMLTSGVKAVTDFRVPLMIYRGVWKDGAYEAGDTITWDGSLWHCEAPTAGKPGESGGWKLVAKRGRDGKDGKAIGTGGHEIVRLGA